MSQGNKKTQGRRKENPRKDKQRHIKEFLMNYSGNTKDFLRNTKLILCNYWEIPREMIRTYPGITRENQRITKEFLWNYSGNVKEFLRKYKGNTQKDKGMKSETLWK